MSLSGSKRRYSGGGGSPASPTRFLRGFTGRRLVFDDMPVRGARYRRRAGGLIARAARFGRKRTGYMNITRNSASSYMAPGPTLGTMVYSPAPSASNGIQYGPVVASGGLIAGLYDVPFSWTFQGSQVLSITDLQNMFDVYRLNKVQVRISITKNAVTGAPGAGAAVTANDMITNPSVWWYADHDDANVESPSVVRERMGVRMKQLMAGRPITMTVRPRVDAPIYTTGGVLTAAAVGKPNQWLDTAGGMSIPHYGLKGFFGNVDLRPAAIPGYQIQMDVKYFISLKDVR